MIMDPVGNRKSGKFVTPGDKLGVIEEFLPGLGTYVDDGNIYSLTTGQLLMDMLKREVAVHSTVRVPSIPKKGNIIVGQITNIQDRNLVLKIFQINEKTIPVFTGIMHISDVSKGYIKTMFDAFKGGDIIRAKVISTANREFHLSTQEDNLGVIHAFCSHCGHSLILQNSQLLCSHCKRIERRKIASDYEKSFS